MLPLVQRIWGLNGLMSGNFHYLPKDVWGQTSEVLETSKVFRERCLGPNLGGFGNLRGFS